MDKKLFSLSSFLLCLCVVSKMQIACLKKMDFLFQDLKNIEVWSAWEKVGKNK